MNFGDGLSKIATSRFQYICLYFIILERGSEENDFLATPGACLVLTALRATETVVWFSKLAFFQSSKPQNHFIEESNKRREMLCWNGKPTRLLNGRDCKTPRNGEGGKCVSHNSL